MTRMTRLALPWSNDHGSIEGIYEPSYRSGSEPRCYRGRMTTAPLKDQVSVTAGGSYPGYRGRMTTAPLKGGSSIGGCEAVQQLPEVTVVE